MEFRFTVRDDKKVKKALSDVARGTMKVAIVALTEYILGDKSRGLRHDDPYRFASRAKAYGKVSDAPEGYFSWKQFRYVAAITKGFTDLGRKRSPTNSSESWGYKLSRGGYRAVLTNDAPSTQWIRGDDTQAAQPALVGWRKVTKVISDNINGAMRHMRAEIGRYLKSRK